MPATMTDLQDLEQRQPLRCLLREAAKLPDELLTPIAFALWMITKHMKPKPKRK